MTFAQWSATVPLALIAVFSLLFGVVIAALVSRARAAVQRAGVDEMLAARDATIAELKAERAELDLHRRELLATGARAEQEAGRLPALEESISALRQQLSETERTLADQRAGNASLTSSIAQERRGFEEKLTLLDEARGRLSREFENLANRIFDQKSEKLTQVSRSNLDLTIAPLRDQLKDFRKRIDDVYDREARERTTLLGEIKHLKELNQQISEDAVNLTKALRGDRKFQGNWGEIVLERVLEESGLRKGYEYDTQVALQDADGRRRNPDVIVHLPENRDIVIDAKVSLTHYEQYCSAETPEERECGLRGHLASVKNHIDGLSVKAYEHLEGIHTLDFVLIFIPIEAAFLLAFEQQPELFRDAYDKNIIVVSPTTLLATLRTVQTIWRYERQNRNAEEIARQAGRLHDQIALVAESLDALGGHLQRAEQAYEKSIDRLTRGKGNLVRRAENLERLGAKVKKQLPAGMRSDNDGSGIEDDD